MTSKIDISKTGSDPRYTLNPEELKAVMALKSACNKESIYYRDIFELSKYVMVVHSSYKDSNPKAGEKRLKKALKLIKTRNAHNSKHGFDKIDPFEALKKVHEAAPRFFVQDYTQDEEGHGVVAHHQQFAPAEYMSKSKENTDNFIVQEQMRYDLGAVDLEQARRGICLVGVMHDTKDPKNKFTPAKGFRYLKMVSHGQENLKPMHPNRMRKIHAEVPVFFTYLVPVAKKLLPSKVANRLEVYGTVEEMEAKLKRSATENQNPMEWARERRAQLEETVAQMNQRYL